MFYRGHSDNEETMALFNTVFSSFPQAFIALAQTYVSGLNLSSLRQMAAA